MNLRSGLLKLLENAKRLGVLGRDTILRKTMLDECRGERLEEVLGAFSSAVLKKVVADEIVAGTIRETPALELSLDSSGKKDDPAALRTLTLAYRASLCSLLQHKSNAKAKCRDFEELLAIKERGLARRMEAVEERSSRESFGRMSEGERNDMRRTMRNNWTGNEAWVDTLLYGNDAAKNRSGLLATPFDRIWNRVQQGRLAEVEDDGRGLLEQLDTRVQLQRERLARWSAFHRDMAYDKVPPSPSKRRAPIPKKKGMELSFEAHKDLQLGHSRSARTSLNEDIELEPEYEQIMEHLTQELAVPLFVTPQDILGPIMQRQRRESYLEPETFEEDAISDMSELDDEPEEPKILPKPVHVPLRAAKRLPRRPVVQPRQTSRDTSRSLNSHGSARDLREEYSRKASFEIPKPEPPVYDAALRNREILDSIDRDSSSPSPTKRGKPRHTLSLAERTRLSMARTSRVFDEDELPLGPSVANKPAKANREPTPEEPDMEEGYADLASRTRKSMAGFEKAQQKAQMERRRSMRRSKVLPQREVSYIPKVDEEELTSRIERLMKEDNIEAIFGSKKGGTPGGSDWE